MNIDYRATERARSILASLGRTEDVCFSPTNRRLAVVAFKNARIAILDIQIGKAGGSPDVVLTGGIEISSPALRYPHGADFLDDDTLAVASRDGGVAIFRLPAGDCVDLAPIQMLEPGSIVRTPGSVSVLGGEAGLSELLICNNYADTVSRHTVDRNAGCAIVKSEVLLRKWIDLPDGVCASQDGKWIAVSNHNTHGVLLYERSDSLNEESSPAGVLRGASYPHGLRFSTDGRYLFLADAGAPYVHVYACGDQGWHGTRTPAASIRMMDEKVFRAGRPNLQEGGPKGIDLDDSMTVLATTCECQPLQFLDATAVLAAVQSVSPVMEVEYELGQLEVAAQIKAHARHAEERAANAEARAAMADARAAGAERQARELTALAAHQEGRAEKFKAKAAQQKAKAARARARAGFVIGGRRWPITAPLSRLLYAFKRPN